MRRRELIHSLALAALASPGLTSALARPAINVPVLDKPLYDELFYVGKPDLTRYGLSPIHVAYTWQLWGERQFNGFIENEPPIGDLLSYAERYRLLENPPELVVLDIEHWKHYGDISEQKLKANIAKYITCLDMLRSAFPRSTKFSLYNIGAQPNHGHLDKRKLTARELLKWQRSNDLTAPMVEKMDFLTPSMYFFKDQAYADWERKSGYFFEEARRLGQGKPVIPFIWPQYADLSPLKHLPSTIWKQLLEFSYKHSDGVVLWRRHNGPLANNWNSKADWWLETMAFVERKARPEV